MRASKCHEYMHQCVGYLGWLSWGIRSGTREEGFSETNFPDLCTGVRGEVPPQQIEEEGNERRCAKEAVRRPEPRRRFHPVAETFEGVFPLWCGCDWGDRCGCGWINVRITVVWKYYSWTGQVVPFSSEIFESKTEAFGNVFPLRVMRMWRWMWINFENSQLNTSGCEPRTCDTPVSHSIDIPTEELKVLRSWEHLASSHNTRSDSQAHRQSNQHHIHTHMNTHTW